LADGFFASGIFVDGFRGTGSFKAGFDGTTFGEAGLTVGDTDTRGRGRPGNVASLGSAGLADGVTRAGRRILPGSVASLGNGSAALIGEHRKNRLSSPAIDSRCVLMVADPALEMEAAGASHVHATARKAPRASIIAAMRRELRAHARICGFSRKNTKPQATLAGVIG
jgi:hypothetical protein